MLKNLINYYRKHKKNQRGEPEFNCYIADATKRPPTFGFETITEDLIPQESREREYKGYIVHFLARQRDGKTLLPIEAPNTLGKDDETPSGVYAALNPPGLEYLLRLSPSKWKQATTIILSVIIFIEIIFGFIILGGKL